jgi:LacI family transcriptional regulator
MHKPIQIGLMVTHSFAYYRGVLRGIGHYAQTRPRWQFVSIVPGRESVQWRGRHRPVGLIASVNTQQVVRALSSWPRPLVNVCGLLPGLRFPRVGVDNVLVGRVAAAHFLECGLYHFGFVGPPDYLYSTLRHEGYCQTLREAGYTVVSYGGLANRPFDPTGQSWHLDRGVHRWLRALPKPVGVFVPDDDWGVQVAEVCRQVGLRVPEDVALLGVDDDDLYCELARPPLSSVILPTKRIGYEAAALLDRLLDGARPPAEPILIPPIGVEARRSTEVLSIQDREVVQAVRFIREHAHLPLRVTDVLREVPVGRRTLERRCYKALGWGLGEEIRRVHLERARRLLANTDLPMKTLAHQAGFSDFRQMAVLFRRELGMPPTAFRRQMRATSGGVAP